MASKIKIIRANTTIELETAANTFLEDKTIVGLHYSNNGVFEQLALAYTESDPVTTEEPPAETTPTTETPGDNTPSGDDETEPPGETEPTEET